MTGSTTNASGTPPPGGGGVRIHSSFLRTSCMSLLGKVESWGTSFVDLICNQRRVKSSSRSSPLGKGPGGRGVGLVGGESSLFCLDALRRLHLVGGE